MRIFRLLIILGIVGSLAYGGYTCWKKHNLTKKVSDLVNTDLQFPDGQSDGPMLLTSRKNDPQRKSPIFFKWTDSSGVVHYSNDPDSVPPQYRDKLEQIGAKTVSVGNAVIEEAVESKREITNDAPKTQARLFVSLDCRECEQTQDLLERMAINVEILNIDTDDDALMELKRLNNGYWKTPVLETDNGLIVGYKPNEIKRRFLR